jgi:putative nucleotidyltransferase with HDIG domain
MIIGLSSLTVHQQSLHYLMIPYALLPIIIRVFFDSRTALFAHIITMLIISLMVDNPFQFIMLQISIGMVAVSSLKDMTQRSQLAQTSLYIFLSYTFLFLAFEFIAEGEIERIHYQPIVYFGISSTILLFAYVLIYIFEKIFGLISALTLVELTNVNSDLMISFAEKAPGTFQHTLQVSNLATEAAKKIGANSLLIRTGALYHDIGKMKNPEYFIENQFGAHNPMKDLPLEEAAKLIIGHVSAGVEIAKKSHLPEQIIQFITTHHGLSKTKYFYNSFINMYPDIKPNDELFTYPGPLPNSKETAILMMADAVEARVRSLGVCTDTSISDAVEQMIDSQIADGQFKNAPISFRDVETVKEVFKEKVKNMYHSRIVYPELNRTIN